MASMTPKVISVEILPSNDIEDIHLYSTMYVRFDADLDHKTVNYTNVQVRNELGPSVDLYIKYHTLSRTIEIRNIYELQSETMYDIMILGDDVISGPQVDGITDILGNPMHGNFVYSFTTGTEVGIPYVDPNSIEIPPSLFFEEENLEPFNIIMTSPSVDSYNISSGKIIIKFNRDISATTVKDANIYLVKSDNL